MRILLFTLTTTLLVASSLMAQVPPADPGTASFKWISANILQPKCVECHQRFTNYDAVKRLVVPGQPENSRVLFTLGDGTSCEMPQSLNNAPVQCVGVRGLRAVYWWIKAGANPN